MESETRPVPSYAEPVHYGVRINRIIFWFLAVLGLLSLGSIGWTVRNYVQGMEAASHLRMQLASLKLVESQDPHIDIIFTVTNQSGFRFRMRDFHFSTYLNRNFMGSNYSPFRERILEPYEVADLEFTIPLRPFYMGHVVKAHEEALYNWIVRGRFRLHLPFREREIWLNVWESQEGLGE